MIKDFRVGNHVTNVVKEASKNIPTAIGTVTHIPLTHLSNTCNKNLKSNNYTTSLSGNKN